MKPHSKQTQKGVLKFNRKNISAAKVEIKESCECK